MQTSSLRVQLRQGLELLQMLVLATLIQGILQGRQCRVFWDLACGRVVGSSVGKQSRGGVSWRILPEAVPGLLSGWKVGINVVLEQGWLLCC